MIDCKEYQYHICGFTLALKSFLTNLLCPLPFEKINTNIVKNIKHAILRRPKELAGMALSNLKFHHFVPTLLGVLNCSRHVAMEQWVNLETIVHSPSPKYTCLVCGPNDCTTEFICTHVFSTYNISWSTSPLLSIREYPNFPPGLHNKAFSSLTCQKQTTSTRLYQNFLKFQANVSPHPGHF